MVVVDSEGKRRRGKLSWACIRFSNMTSPEATDIFLNDLRNTCVNLGMDFTMKPEISAYSDYPLPTGIEEALQNLNEFNGQLLKRKQLGLLIVILPDDRIYDEKVEEACKELGFTYHCFSPQYVMMPRQEYLDSAAHEINKKVKKRQDGDSTELCELDEDMGEYSASSFDEEMSLDESTESFYSYEETREFRLFDQQGEHATCNKVPEEENTNEYSDYKTLEENEKPQLGTPTERNHADLVEVQGKRRRAKLSWACIRFSNMTSPEATGIFLNDLRNTCVNLGMDFKLLPVISAHSNYPLPTGIEEALQEVNEFNAQELKGKQLGLLIVILRDERTYDEKVEEVCKELRFTYHCFSPQDVMMARQEYLDSAAHEINKKVKKRQDGDSTELCELDEDMGEYSASSFDEEMSSDEATELFNSYEEMREFRLFDL